MSGKGRAMRARYLCVGAAVVQGLAGCASTRLAASDDGSSSGYHPVPVHQDALRLADAIPKDSANTASRQLATEGIKAMDARQYQKANDLFNLALKVDINNSYLHFLNGLAYHMRGLNGEGALFGMAQQGYEQAIQFDESNVAARHQLGLLFMDRRDYTPAMQALMAASMYESDDPDLLYDLAVASYYARSPQNAYAALEGLRRLQQGKLTPSALRASAIVAAAVGDQAKAKAYLDELALAGGKPEQTKLAARRVRSWQEALGAAPASFQKVQAGANDMMMGSMPGSMPGGMPSAMPGGMPGSMPGGMPGGMDSGGMGGGSPFGQQPQQYGQPSPFGQQPSPYGQQMPFGQQQGMGRTNGFYEKNMVLLDVVIVSTEEDNNDTFGVNLLDGLRIQFGNSQGTPAYSKSVNNTSTNTTTGITNSNINVPPSDLITDINRAGNQVITRLISIPSINYSLNIANAQDRRNEVVARPSLVALGGQTSSFFSGTDVVGAAISSGQGGSVQVQKEAGVKLSVTPEFLPDGLIKMQIAAERTFLTNPNSNVLFDFRLDTSKTLVNANVVMKHGETLILSGLSERNIESSNSGVPVLRDVPVVQYLFNRQVKRDFHKSVLIIVTPRRPNYTNRNPEDVAKEREKFNDFERLQQEFEDRHKLWFTPVPNLAALTNVLETSAVYREFRSGDLEVQSWTSRSTHGGRLKSALQFLYY